VGWNNSVRYSLGLRYDPTRQWSLRLGTAYDETPVPSDVLRTPRIPDSDRIWTTFGVAFRWTDRVRVDFGADPTKIRVRFGSCGVLAALTSARVREAVRAGGVELVSYAELAQPPAACSVSGSSGASSGTTTGAGAGAAAGTGPTATIRPSRWMRSNCPLQRT
jgi:hypothetical protein